MSAKEIEARKLPEGSLQNLREAQKKFKKLPLDDAGNLIKNGSFIQSPRNLVVISFPKMGKTDTMVNVPNILIGDCEGGTDYYAADNIANLTTYDGTEEFRSLKDGTVVPMGIFQTVDELKKANNMSEYWKLYANFIETKGDEREVLHKEVVAFIQTMKFPIFALDTLTHLQDLINKAALVDYNTQFGTKKTNIKRVDDYSGSQYVRRTLHGVKKFIENNAAPFIIYTGHIKEKKKILNKGQEEVSAADMALEGTLGTIFTAKADANCVFYRNDKGCFLDFKKKDETDLDSRPQHLADRVIKIADVHERDKEGNLVERGQTYWSRVYPELQF
jgi:hypothetical protein